MSALTKIFVVLHVIVSLLLAAGMIVFVNRTENYKVAADDAKRKTAIADAKAELAKADADKLAAQMRISEDDGKVRVKDLDAQLAAANDTVRQRDGQIATLTSNAAQATAQVTALTNQVAAVRDELDKTQKLYYGIQNESDKDKGKYSELELAFNAIKNSDIVNKRNLNYMAEKIAELDTTVNKYAELLRKYNITPGSSTTPEKAVLNNEPSININGVVRDMRVINGVPWATISLGSAEAVTRGMQFKVIDQGKFLGYLTVDTVNTHDSVGRLEGDGVRQVRPNLSEVRTHLD